MVGLLLVTGDDGVSVPLSPMSAADDSLAEAVYAITDGIPFKRVGTAMHTLRGTGAGATAGSLVSEVQLELSIFDALLPPGRSTMTTSCEAYTAGVERGCLGVRVQKTEVKASSIPFLDDIAFPTSDVLGASLGLLSDDSSASDATEVLLRTTFLSDTLRISRVVGAPRSYVFAHTREPGPGVE